MNGIALDPVLSVPVMNGLNHKPERDETMSTKKAVLICTQHRGVFYGEVEPDTDLTQRMLTNIENCRMAIYWGTTNGVMQLAETVPTEKSKIGAPATVEVLHDITAVFLVNDEAREKWISA